VLGCMFWRVFVEVEQHLDRWCCATRENLAAVPCRNDVRDLDLSARCNLAVSLHRIEDDTLAGDPICGGLVVGGRGLVPIPGVIAHGSTSVAEGKTSAGASPRRSAIASALNGS
jgi:hypothetical protein